jgi:GDPmannose 4,6-dehydratase
MKVALITGISGMDGHNLVSFLLKKEYKIYGIVRRTSLFNLSRLDKYRKQINLVYGDMTDTSSLNHILSNIKKEMTEEDFLEIYHLAAMSHVGISFEIPENTAQVIAMGCLNLLEAVRNQDMIKCTRIYNASTSEMFGNQPAPQNENTRFDPKSPYAVAKTFAHHICQVYRDSYNMFVCSGVLFNHSDIWRGENFILRKIAMGIAQYKSSGKILTLGNLDAKRDIGASRDYVEGMYLMLQQEKPDDFVLATGTQYKIREFVEMAFEVIGKTITWKDSGLNEKGYDQEGNILVEVNPKYFRPNEVNNLLGNAYKAQKFLGWKPKTSTRDLLREMVEYELDQDV